MLHSFEPWHYMAAISSHPHPTSSKRAPVSHWIKDMVRTRTYLDLWKINLITLPWIESRIIHPVVQSLYWLSAPNYGIRW